MRRLVLFCICSCVAISPLPRTNAPTVASSLRNAGDEALERVLNISSAPLEAFDSVATEGGVRVERHRSTGVLKATATLDAPLAAVVATLRDAARTPEYNAHCAELLEVSCATHADDGADGKGDGKSSTCVITWSASPRVGPFKARDFVTASHWRELGEIVACVHHAVEDFAGAPEPSDAYVRSEVILGAQLLRANARHPEKTDITLLTSIRLGGAATSGAGAAISAKLAESGPIGFIAGLEAASRRTVGLAALVRPTKKRRPWWVFDSVQPTAKRARVEHMRRIWTNTAEILPGGQAS